MVQNKNKFIFVFISILLVLFMFFIIVPTQAVDPVYKTGVSEVAGESHIALIAQAIVPWFNIACLLAAAITIVQLMVTKDQKTVSGAYKYLLMIVATFFVFNMLGAIFQFIDVAIPSVSYDYATNTVS